MLTLGLTEGVLSATLGILFLVGAANENAPLHRIFGPVVVLTLGLAGYMAHDAGAMHSPSDVAGLGFFVTVAFFVPLAIMRFAWKSTRAMASAPVKEQARAARGTAVQEVLVESPKKAA